MNQHCFMAMEPIYFSATSCPSSHTDNNWLVFKSNRPSATGETMRNEAGLSLHNRAEL